MHREVFKINMIYIFLFVSFLLLKLGECDFNSKGDQTKTLIHFKEFEEDLSRSLEVEGLVSREIKSIMRLETQGPRDPRELERHLRRVNTVLHILEVLRRFELISHLI